MLTSILERNSWIIYKFGMPLVYFYHLIISSVFLNTAADDAKGLERLANNALAPMQYFFEGKRAIPVIDENGTTRYLLERRFDYEHHFFIKAAVSTTTLPLSLVVGTALKSLAYLSSETKERAQRLYAAVHSREVRSNLDYYHSIGMQVEDYRNGESIDPPQWTSHPGIKLKLGGDLEGLKAIVEILSAHNIPFWVDCGTCLGCYQYGGAIPHDWDIDIAILQKDFHNIKNALQELDPEKYVVQDWSGRAHPESYLKVYVRESRGIIDLYNFVIDEENQQIHTLLSNEFNIFSPKSWVEREKHYTVPMDFETVFPLKKATFEGIEVPVPQNIKRYLQAFYGENLAPARLYDPKTGKYEKDLTHPYWQDPNAH